jgi:hypothetical protein
VTIVSLAQGDVARESIPSKDFESNRKVRAVSGRFYYQVVSAARLAQQNPMDFTLVVAGRLFTQRG